VKKVSLAWGVSFERSGARSGDADEIPLAVTIESARCARGERRGAREVDCAVKAPRAAAVRAAARRAHAARNGGAFATRMTVTKPARAARAFAIVDARPPFADDAS